ncbi:putative transmembrane protein [Labilithrix luteola]|uniref:Putative transmembrane protein n=1 Tax=Labilithrix luteola TaxID=1391654 RepID=A0A0K1Q1A5_9BACT|nr:DUF4337 domain-containing protein [Labilithrix luteola]AKU99184.1 putative transmembrane protein [Labilithrix luteola]
MPEENLETPELKAQLDETREHVEHAQHGGGEPAGWIMHLSLSTAIIAVFAAIASLQSGAAESEALLSKNESILAQTKASDQWAYYQAKNIKMALYEVQLETATNPETIAKFRAERDRYEHERQDIEREARALENESEEKGKAGEEHYHRHHRFALAVTIFQISIALAAIAALTRRRPLWLASMAIGVAGLFFFAKGVGLFGG